MEGRPGLRSAGVRIDWFQYRLVVSRLHPRGA